ncbi:hypothetical protein V5799_019760 [Amblyomma americanum]|uniref:Uncharacterized protein n=1 Tax=Amblyomma americanum TaxID=6943 RepID=A0AAQ4EW15_AMBAM
MTHQQLPDYDDDWKAHVIEGEGYTSKRRASVTRLEKRAPGAAYRGAQHPHRTSMLPGTVALRKPYALTYDGAAKALDGCFSPKRHQITEGFWLFNRSQKEGDPVQEFSL